MIIGIVGKAGSGKDTVAKFVCDNHGGTRLAFADILKRFVQDVFGFTDEQLWGPSARRLEGDPTGQTVKVCTNCGYFGQNEKTACPVCSREDTHSEVPLSSRLALQTLGTNWGRALMPMVWALRGVRQARQCETDEGYENVVFSDCRFLNETKAIKDAGGQIWRVIRPGTGDSGGLGSSHPSEAEQDRIEADVTIFNAGSLDDLEALINQLLNPKETT